MTSGSGDVCPSAGRSDTGRLDSDTDEIRILFHAAHFCSTESSANTGLHDAEEDLTQRLGLSKWNRILYLNIIIVQIILNLKGICS